MNTNKDYYEILGIEESCDSSEIKAAYRKLALKYHPDHNPGNNEAEERFKEVSEANRVLGKPENKKRYDEYKKYGGIDGFDLNGFNGKFNGNPEDILKDLMEELLKSVFNSTFFSGDKFRKMMGEYERIINTTQTEYTKSIDRIHQRYERENFSFLKKNRTCNKAFRLANRITKEAEKKVGENNYSWLKNLDDKTIEKRFIDIENKEGTLEKIIKKFKS